MSLFLTMKEESHRAQCAVSREAGVTLVAGCSEYVAQFNSALRVAEVLGSRELRNLGDGIFESIPIYKIPVEAMAGTLEKLSLKYSIALVDVICDKNGSRFVLLWKIPKASTAATPKPIFDLDEY